MDEALAQFVRDRAGYACEYCRIPQVFYPTVTFPIDHIIARQHGGETTAENLAMSCLHDNSYKGPNIAGIDPRTRKLTPLFNPRRHRWRAHFRWNGPIIVGRTPVGRATVLVLNMNHPDAVAVRAALIEEGVFPPDD
jgi:hypothetical protein